MSIYMKILKVFNFILISYFNKSINENIDLIKFQIRPIISGMRIQMILSLSTVVVSIFNTLRLI